jgi:hypothetical protein
LSSVEILSPEANLSSSHTTKTTSLRRYAIAEADTPRDFLLKTGLKSDFGPVEPEQGVAKSNRAYAVSSDTSSEAQDITWGFPPSPRLCQGAYANQLHSDVS